MTDKKIITYNVNGIRAALKKGFAQWLQEEAPDVICLQETKAHKEQVETAVFDHLGYKHYWFSAEKKGYSGVAILSKEEPKHVEYGCGNELYDREGRVIRADFEGYSVLSIYHPSGSSGDGRQAFKMAWLDYFLNFVDALREDHEKLILCGDYNICHKPIDIHDPVRNKDSSGFLPEEREWFDKFVAEGYYDSFRMLHEGEPDRYSWWSFRANSRARNKGWRIDYIMLTAAIKDQLKESEILPDVKHSDHCPVRSILDL